MKLVIAAAIASATLLAVVAPASAQPAKQQCLRNNQIDSFSSIRGDERHIVVIDRFRNKYKLGFNTVCDGVDFNGALQIRSLTNSALSCITRGDQVISQGFAGQRDRCVITSVTPYTVAMEQADRDRAAAR